jgi:dihydroorotase (multifunctional complex type)
MVMIDLVITNGKIVTPQSIFSAGIGINEGKIVAICGDRHLPKADQVLDVHGNFILPGFIDSHTHIETYPEDFESGTKSAAAGGITTIFEMPFTREGAVSSAKKLHERRKRLERKAVVDFALYGGAGIHNLDTVLDLAGAGAIAFKTFLNAIYGDILEGVFVTDDGELLKMFQAVAQTNLPSCIHAENDEVIQMLGEKIKRSGRKDPIIHAESRPGYTENLAISTVSILSRIAGVHAHICHMSTKEGVQIVRRAKAIGQRITSETTPHHLLLTAKNMKEFGPYAKVNPPLRSKPDLEELWRGLDDGTVDIITTDHSPHPKEEKDRGWSNIWDAPPGAPGFETTLQLLLTKVNEGKISLGKLVEKTSENVAKTFGIFPKKGVIQVGSDADLTIVNMKKESKINSEKMYTKAKDVTLFDGWKVKGLPETTIVEGKIVMKDGIVIGRPGDGSFISPSNSLTRILRK